MLSLQSLITLPDLRPFVLSLCHTLPHWDVNHFCRHSYHPSLHLDIVLLAVTSVTHHHFMTCIIRAVPLATHTTPGLAHLCCPCVTHHHFRSLIIRAVICSSPHQGLIRAVILFSPITSSGHVSFVLSLQSPITTSGH